MKPLVTYFLLALSPISINAQKDTVYFDNLIGFDTSIFVSNKFEFNPETDTIYNKIDSSEHNGILHYNHYIKNSEQAKLEMLYETSFYSVSKGICKPTYLVEYFQNPKEPARNKIRFEAFFSDTLNKTIAYNKNGNPWCYETWYLDTLGINISEKIILDSVGRLMTKTQRKDGYLDGLIQIVISYGDTLTLLYETGHLVEVLNDNVLFFSKENRLVSESEFIDRNGDWVYYWSYIIVPCKTKSKILFYRYDGNDCQIRVFPEGYCLTEERRKLISKKAK